MLTSSPHMGLWVAPRFLGRMGQTTKGGQAMHKREPMEGMGRSIFPFFDVDAPMPSGTPEPPTVIIVPVETFPHDPPPDKPRRAGLG